MKRKRGKAEEEKMKALESQQQSLATVYLNPFIFPESLNFIRIYIYINQGRMLIKCFHSFHVLQLKPEYRETRTKAT